jgi:hypothetical protein
MEVPEGMEDLVNEFLSSQRLSPDSLGDKIVVLRLLKSLYGLK